MNPYAPIEKELLSIAKEGIKEIDVYNPTDFELTDHGRFEVILYNSTIALWFYNSGNRMRQPADNKKYLRELTDQAAAYGINMTENDLIKFILSRLEFYAEEYNQLSKTEYIPGKVFSNFYIKPLAIEPGPHVDAAQMPLFKFGLISMSKMVKELIFSDY